MSALKPIFVEIAGKRYKLARNLNTIIYLRELQDTAPETYAKLFPDPQTATPAQLETAQIRALPHLIHAMCTNEQDAAELTPEFLSLEVDLQELLAIRGSVQNALGQSVTTQSKGPVTQKKRPRAKS